MIKKYENFDYEEEQDEPLYSFVGFYMMRDYPSENTFFIMEENISDQEIILYDQYRYTIKEDPVWKYCRYVPEQDIKDYIYNNKLPISVFDKNYKENSGWKKVFFKDLPKYIKNEL